MPDRPSVRLIKALLRRDLDPLHEHLDSLDAAADIEVGIPVEVTNASTAWRFDLRATRLAVQMPLPGMPPAAPRPLETMRSASRCREPPLADKDIHARILAKATPTPEKAATIIRRTPHKVNSNSRQAVYDLAAAGKLIRHDGNRYSLPATSAEPDTCSA